MANIIYNSALLKLLNGSIDLDTDTLKVGLVSSSYVPNRDTDVFYSNITNELPTAGGYTQGGATITGATMTQDNTNDRAVFDANDSQWAAATFTARGAFIYKDTGNAATSPLVCYIDFLVDKQFSAELAKIIWDTVGILYASQV